MQPPAPFRHVWASTGGGYYRLKRDGHWLADLILLETARACLRDRGSYIQTDISDHLARMSGAANDDNN